jgi:hypothetical protein
MPPALIDEPLAFKAEASCVGEGLIKKNPRNGNLPENSFVSVSLHQHEIFLLDLLVKVSPELLANSILKVLSLAQGVVSGVTRQNVPLVKAVALKCSGPALPECRLQSLTHLHFQHI